MCVELIIASISGLAMREEDATEICTSPIFLDRVLNAGKF